MPPKVLALVLTVMVGAACATGSSRPQAGGRETSTTPSTEPPRIGAPRFAVGRLEHDFVDDVRGRMLHSIIHFPAAGAPGGAGGAPIPGPFPLALMAHGYRLPAGGYERIIGAVAADGWIVVAPAFPHTSAERGDGLRSDIVNQPADMSFLVDAVAGLARDRSDLLPAVADPGRVAALGHSDGGLTVSAWAYGDSYRDPRVACAVVMTGGTGLFPTSYFGGAAPPLLAVHGTADETNPLSASTSLFSSVPAGTPRFLLAVEGGSHLGPFMFDTASGDVAQAIVDFLAAECRRDPAALARLMADGTQPGLALQAG